MFEGHRLHCSDVNVLDFATENVTPLPDTTHYAQPLDRVLLIATEEMLNTQQYRLENSKTSVQ